MRQTYLIFVVTVECYHSLSVRSDDLDEEKKREVAGSEIPISIPAASATLSHRTIHQWTVKHWNATEGSLKEPRASLDSLINGCLRL